MSSPSTLILGSRGRVRLGALLGVALAAELVFFFAVPAIPLAETGTSQCSVRAGFCLSTVEYGSVAYVFACSGASVVVRTSVTTPTTLVLGNETLTMAHFNGTLPLWAPAPVSGYSFGCVFA